MNTLNHPPSRSTPQRIVSEIYSGGGGPGGEYSQARSRSEMVWISDAKRQVREQMNQRLRVGFADQADTHSDMVHPHLVGAGSRVWLYLDRVRE
ncbi:LOW QUALITY PROTEIN: hypothetical protein PHMEG_00034399 [Phytophthora megakarya]|uniref:Reverse transcriptase n=1 Tax=Phytophthora megakarya TaxID=4795 RepID=A0A225UR45_9STRA|nr:LOW QUALITY PROTEIN: hypothetical protein PHMEG_00034399 [Phytophthora megakarya]